jgi:hypothetical protein
MITVLDNYISNTQCNSILNLWNTTDIISVNDNIYHFHGLNLIPHLKEVINIIPEFIKCNFKKFRIQCTDENIQQVKTTHFHINPHSFVIFLNDEYTGGELVFNELIIKPKIGTMVYFTGEESHRVEDCIGKRFTLVGFLHNDLFKSKNTTII